MTTRSALPHVSQPLLAIGCIKTQVLVSHYVAGERSRGGGALWLVVFLIQQRSIKQKTTRSLMVLDTTCSIAHVEPCN